MMNFEQSTFDSDCKAPQLSCWLGPWLQLFQLEHKIYPECSPCWFSLYNLGFDVNVEREHRDTSVDKLPPNRVLNSMFSPKTETMLLKV